MNWTIVIVSLVVSFVLIKGLKIWSEVSQRREHLAHEERVEKMKLDHELEIREANLTYEKEMWHLENEDLVDLRNQQERLRRIQDEKRRICLDLHEEARGYRAYSVAERLLKEAFSDV